MKSDEQERLQEIEARVEGATKGPWNYDEALLSDEVNTVSETICINGSVSDLRFCAHARTDIPYLLDLVKKAREREATYENNWVNTVEKLEAELSSAREREKRLRDALECIIELRQHNGGPCDKRCEGCSECVATKALAKETPDA